MDVELLLAYDKKKEIKELFDAYIKMLIEKDPVFEYYLGLQNYDEEIKDLKGKYGLPQGRLYLALYKGQPAGCIALRKIDDEKCEMKRLYVYPEFRNKNIGRKLVEKVINDGKEIGYKAMLLDTLTYFKAAISIYKSYGFIEIPAYLYSPMENTVYMKLDLKKSPYY